MLVSCFLFFSLQWQKTWHVNDLSKKQNENWTKKIQNVFKKAGHFITRARIYCYLAHTLNLKLLSLLNKFENVSDSISCTFKLHAVPRIQIKFSAYVHIEKGWSWVFLRRAICCSTGSLESTGRRRHQHHHLSLCSITTAPSSLSRAAGHFTDAFSFYMSPFFAFR